MPLAHPPRLITTSRHCGLPYATHTGAVTPDAPHCGTTWAWPSPPHGHPAQGAGRCHRAPLPSLAAGRKAQRSTPKRMLRHTIYLLYRRLIRLPLAVDATARPDVTLQQVKAVVPVSKLPLGHLYLHAGPATYKPFHLTLEHIIQGGQV